MDSRARTCWRAIEAQLLHGGAAGGPTPRAPSEPIEGACTGVSRARRLAALHRLQNGEALGSLRLVDTARAAPVTDPADVDWTGFPVLEALEAVARDELRLLRDLLDETPHPAPASLREDALTSPAGLAWGIDLRGAPSSEL